MLGYRHIFHAGGAADVFKHCVLAFCLHYLCEKEKGFLYVDTHAGAGLYALDSADQFFPPFPHFSNKEWKTGINALKETGKEKIPRMVRDYLALETDGLFYQGSPFIAEKILRNQDRIVCYEKHPADFSLLASYAEKNQRIEARNADGFDGLKSCLPPPSRRGCVLIDPSYETDEDYKAVSTAMADALRRFPSGIYIVWYPLLRLDKSGERLRDRLFLENNAEKIMGKREKKWYAELITEEKDAVTVTKKGGLYGSGLAVFNAPWTLASALEETLPFLAETLGNKRGSYHFRQFDATKTGKNSLN
jgi:23S rRNA (adenine2030-N6)-methyltransferase